LKKEAIKEMKQKAILDQSFNKIKHFNDGEELFRQPDKDSKYVENEIDKLTKKSIDPIATNVVNYLSNKSSVSPVT
jgi:hypothetical protein